MAVSSNVLSGDPSAAPYAARTDDGAPPSGEGVRVADAGAVQLSAEPFWPVAFFSTNSLQTAATALGLDKITLALIPGVDLENVADSYLTELWLQSKNGYAIILRQDGSVSFVAGAGTSSTALTGGTSDMAVIDVRTRMSFADIPLAVEAMRTGTEPAFYAALLGRQPLAADSAIEVVPAVLRKIEDFDNFDQVPDPDWKRQADQLMQSVRGLLRSAEETAQDVGEVVGPVFIFFETLRQIMDGAPGLPGLGPGADADNEPYLVASAIGIPSNPGAPGQGDVEAWMAAGWPGDLVKVEGGDPDVVYFRFKGRALAGTLVNDDIFAVPIDDPVLAPFASVIRAAVNHMPTGVTLAELQEGEITTLSSAELTAMLLGNTFDLAEEGIQGQMRRLLDYGTSEQLATNINEGLEEVAPDLAGLRRAEQRLEQGESVWRVVQGPFDPETGRFQNYGLVEGYEGTARLLDYAGTVNRIVSAYPEITGNRTSTYIEDGDRALYQDFVVSTRDAAHLLGLIRAEMLGENGGPDRRPEWGQIVDALALQAAYTGEYFGIPELEARARSIAPSLPEEAQADRSEIARRLRSEASMEPLPYSSYRYELRDGEPPIGFPVRFDEVRVEELRDDVDAWTADMFALHADRNAERLAERFRDQAGYNPSTPEYREALDQLVERPPRGLEGDVGALARALYTFDTLRVGARQDNGPETVDALLNLASADPQSQRYNGASVWYLAALARSLNADDYEEVKRHPALRFALTVNEQLEALGALGGQQLQGDGSVRDTYTPVRTTQEASDHLWTSYRALEQGGGSGTWARVVERLAETSVGGIDFGLPALAGRVEAPDSVRDRQLLRAFYFEPSRGTPFRVVDPETRQQTAPDPEPPPPKPSPQPPPAEPPPRQESPQQEQPPAQSAPPPPPQNQPAPVAPRREDEVDSFTEQVFGNTYVDGAAAASLYRRLSGYNPFSEAYAVGQRYLLSNTLPGEVRPGGSPARVAVAVRAFDLLRAGAMLHGQEGVDLNEVIVNLVSPIGSGGPNDRELARGISPWTLARMAEFLPEDAFDRVRQLNPALNLAITTNEILREFGQPPAESYDQAVYQFSRIQGHLKTIGQPEVMNDIAAILAPSADPLNLNLGIEALEGNGNSPLSAYTEYLRNAVTGALYAPDLRSQRQETPTALLALAGLGSTELPRSPDRTPFVAAVTSLRSTLAHALPPATVDAAFQHLAAALDGDDPSAALTAFRATLDRTGSFSPTDLDRVVAGLSAIDQASALAPTIQDVLASVQQTPEHPAAPHPGLAPAPSEPNAFVLS